MDYQLPPHKTCLWVDYHPWAAKIHWGNWGKDLVIVCIAMHSHRWPACPNHKGVTAVSVDPALGPQEGLQESVVRTVGLGMTLTFLWRKVYLQGEHANTFSRNKRAYWFGVLRNKIHLSKSKDQIGFIQWFTHQAASHLANRKEFWRIEQKGDL